MPVEIRELIIKTKVVDETKSELETITISHEDLNQLKREILLECRKMIKKEISNKSKR
jgi:hypothetical protein